MTSSLAQTNRYQNTKKKKSTINTVRQRIVDKHYDELIRNGETEHPSPIIRKFIYDKLETEGLKWTTETIGYTNSGKRMTKYSHGPGDDHKTVAKFIKLGKLIKQDAIDAYEPNNIYGVTLDNINNAFDLTADNDIREKAVEKLCHIPNKYNYMSFLRCRKPIKKIKLINI